MSSDYMIYKFSRPQEDKCVTEFFLPDKRLADKMSRLKKLNDYQRAGYKCIGFIAVDKEMYLNAKLNETVKDYCANEEHRQQVIDKYRCGDISRKVFYETMTMIDEYKWTCLLTLDRQVCRMSLEDIDIHNEVAIQLYDGIRGLNSVQI